MESEAFASMGADIKVNGLQYPIMEFGEAILDGRNRHLAFIERGIDRATPRAENTG